MKLDLVHGQVEMTHGGGGRAMNALIDQVFRPALGGGGAQSHDDFAAFAADGGRLVMAVDSHVITPLFFPGGDIGSLAVHGTINDVAMSGARPLALSAAFIIEEGFPLADLVRIANAMGEAAREAGVPVITGDTKVVERGKGDGVFIATTGVGVVAPGVSLSGANIRPGDAVLISGTMGDHGVAVMACREALALSTPLRSDTAALHGLVADMLASGAGLRALRDPTRGGLAAVMNEFAHQSGVGFRLEESAIPVRAGVAGACELLGLDPLNVANEGKLVAVCAPEDADGLLGVMRAHPLGREAAIIGTAVADANRFVQMRTRLGGARIVDWLSGEQLPRIC